MDDITFLDDADDMRVLDAALSFMDAFNTNQSATVQAESSTFVSPPLDLSRQSCVNNDSDDSDNGPSIFAALETEISTTDQHFLPATTKPSSLTKTKKANPNRARNEQRYELAFLRQKVTQLQQQLHSLQLYRRRNSDDRTDATSSDINCTHPSVNSIQSVIAWKSVAKRQCCRRESSERKNARLKLIVERQWRVATDLNTLLRKRMAECSLMFPGDAEGRISRVVDFNDDMERFHDLFNRLDEAYHELDAVFAFNGLASMEMSTHDVHVRERAGGKLLEFFANKLLPFSSQNTAVSVWNYFKGDEKHSGNGGLYEKAMKEVFSNNSRADITVKQVVRRFPEIDRDIVIIVSKVEPAEINHKAITGLTYCLQGYALTKCCPASTPDHPLSMLQLCSLISLESSSGVINSPSQARVVSRFLSGNTAANIRCNQERIEGTLVDQSFNAQVRK